VTKVVGVGAAHGAGGVEGAAWADTEVMGAARRATKVGKASDEGATQGLVVGPTTSLRGGGGGLTTWARGLSANLCFRGGVAAWAHGLTVRLCSRHGRIV
jgi:hypothetical protein